MALVWSISLLALGACSSELPEVDSGERDATKWAESILAQTDRSAEDRERDERRRPVELLVFAGVEPGMRVADLGAATDRAFNCCEAMLPPSLHK